MRLLIEGSFGATPLGDVDTIDSFVMTDFQIFKIDNRYNYKQQNQAKDVSAMYDL